MAINVLLVGVGAKLAIYSPDADPLAHFALQVALSKAYYTWRHTSDFCDPLDPILSRLGTVLVKMKSTVCIWCLK